MQYGFSQKAIAFLLSTAGVTALGTGLVACSSGGSASPGGPTPDGSTANTVPDTGANNDAGGGGATDDGPAGLVSDASGSCANPTVQIDFAPSYSAFIPGSALHIFQVPAITDDGNVATWSVSDPTQVQLTMDSFNGSPGVMITVSGVGDGSDGGEGALGQVTVYATEADGSCGSSVLTITSAQESDWTIGNTRYNNDVTLTVTPRMGMMRPPDGGVPTGAVAVDDAGSIYERDGGTACTNCHGPTADSPTSPYHNVSHTPEQTGGFSDQELIGIITQGIVPDGGYFDPSVIIPTCDGGGAPIPLPDGGTSTCTELAFNTWHAFHQWADITPEQYAGIVVYLRSLQPLPQNGSPAANFGRGGTPPGRRDGGVGPGRGGRPDAGALDAGAPGTGAPDATIPDAETE